MEDSNLHISASKELPNLFEQERELQQIKSELKIEQEKLVTKRHKEIRNIAVGSFIVAIISVIIAVTALAYTICHNA